MSSGLTGPDGPDVAMVLAAGLGTRMRPLTERMPKALVPVLGRALIDHVLDRLIEVGVRRVVVNLHHHADLLEAHLTRRRDVDILLSDERGQLLDTGGGVARALPLLDAETFFVLNVDSIWIEGMGHALARLARYWRPDDMDVLMLLASTVTATGYQGRGDFVLGADGRVSRRPDSAVVPFAFAGPQILKAALFDGLPSDEPFSMWRLWTPALDQARLYGVRHDGVWLHVGSPDAIVEAEAALRSG